MTLGHSEEDRLVVCSSEELLRNETVVSKAERFTEVALQLSKQLRVLPSPLNGRT